MLARVENAGERILAANDADRRRLERRLHDGAQQRVIALTLELKLAAAETPSPRIARAIERADQLLEELRELARTLYPAILTEGGLRPALRALARRSAVPVRLSVEIDERFADAVELAAYHVVADALAGAEGAEIAIRVERADGQLRVTVDGAPGDLTSAADRVEVLGGRLTTTGREGGGATLSAELPPRPR